jgi:hypothetical protein
MTQFVASASYDKYQIHLRDRILVAHANTYDGIMQDWLLIQQKINHQEIIQSNIQNKVQAILDQIEQVRKEQKQLKREILKTQNQTIEDDRKSSFTIESKNEMVISKASNQRVESDDDYQGDTETNKKPQRPHWRNKGQHVMQDPIHVIEEIFENQRKGVFGSFSENLLYTDKCGPWSTRDLAPISKEQFALPENWKWTTDWIIDTDPSIIGDTGWRYAMDWNTSWSVKPSKTTFVRRRRWVRERVYEG